MLPQGRPRTVPDISGLREGLPTQEARAAAGAAYLLRHPYESVTCGIHGPTYGKPRANLPPQPLASPAQSTARGGRSDDEPVESPSLTKSKPRHQSSFTVLLWERKSR